MERNRARDLMTFLGQQHSSQAIELRDVIEADGIDASEIGEAIALAEDALRDAEHLERIVAEMVNLCDAGIGPQPAKGRPRKQRRFVSLISSARIVLDRIEQSRQHRNVAGTKSPAFIVAPVQKVNA